MVSVVVYPRSLRAQRKEKTSTDRLKIMGNCIKTMDYSISFYMLMTHSYINDLNVVDTYQIRITPQ